MKKDVFDALEKRCAGWCKKVSLRSLHSQAVCVAVSAVFESVFDLSVLDAMPLENFEKTAGFARLKKEFKVRPADFPSRQCPRQA
jgi:hypothetical protein